MKMINILDILSFALKKNLKHDWAMFDIWVCMHGPGLEPGTYMLGKYLQLHAIVIV